MNSKERLENLAAHALKEAKGDPGAAAKALLPKILALGLTELLLSAYLETRNGASQCEGDRQRASDRPDSAPSQSSQPSHAPDESHRDPDRPAAPSTRDDGVSLGYPESLLEPDLPVAPAPKKKIATVSPDMKRAARKTDVYDTVIGNSISFRDAALYDLINGKRAGDTVSYVCGTIMDEFDFPDMYDTKVPDLVPPKRLKEILAEARARLAVEVIRG